MDDKKILMKIIEIREEITNVKTFRFESVDETNLEFLPGQFVFLYAKIKGEYIKRAYSIASSPLNKDFIELTLELSKEGKMTTYFHEEVKIGDIFEIGEPRGHFSYTDDIKEIVLIAGGSGIVPMRSIIKYCSMKKLDTKIILFYSVKDFECIIYKDELKSFKGINPNFDIIYTLTRQAHKDWKGKTGRFTSHMILENIEQPKKFHFYLCGPMEMVKNIGNELKEKGIDKKKIKRDLWGV